MADNHTDALLVEIRDTLQRIEQLMRSELEIKRVQRRYGRRLDFSLLSHLTNQGVEVIHLEPKDEQTT